MSADAGKLVVALVTTTTRYRLGCMARATWRTHMRHLWAKIDAEGLRADVERLLELIHA